MTRRKRPVDDGFRHPGDFGQGPRFPWGFAESRVPQADASYQGYGAYASLDGSRVDDNEYAELDWPGMELEPDLAPEHAVVDHTGRGPRGYRRSDVSIRDDLGAVLTAHAEIDASEVDVHVSGGEVLLLGTVRRRATKRLIEDIAYGISGVRDVTNLLRISAVEQPRRPIEVPIDDAEDDRPAPPHSTHEDDHPSRRDAWASAHLRQRGDLVDQKLRAAARKNLHSHDVSDPHDTSSAEPLQRPEKPLHVPRARR